jgi:hypothetical protein
MLIAPHRFSETAFAIASVRGSLATRTLPICPHSMSSRASSSLPLASPSVPGLVESGKTRVAFAVGSAKFESNSVTDAFGPDDLRTLERVVILFAARR